LLRHDELVYQAHFSPDGQRIATACADNFARIFDFRTGELACKTVTHWVDVFDAAFSYDGRWLYTLGDNSLLGIWSAHDGGFVDQLGVSADRSEGPALQRSAQIFAPYPGTTVAVAGRRKQIDLIQLGDFDPGESVTPSILRMIAELAASARIERGGDSPLSTDEWIQLWNEYVQAYAGDLRQIVDSGTGFEALTGAVSAPSAPAE
jgi:WD40 repeat protein